MPRIFLIGTLGLFGVLLVAVSVAAYTIIKQSTSSAVIGLNALVGTVLSNPVFWLGSAIVVFIGYRLAR